MQVEYPPSTANQLQIAATYIMWIPDDVAGFRCVIVHQHGAGGFFVMRDNRVLSRLRTMTPTVVYGRPLFQRLSYHDTPEGPPSGMRYLGVSAKPGEKHIYSVLTVNSAGVPSEPSAGVIFPSPESRKE